jgi:dipeptidyl aminopeptidase/acylaminoacyl peptidase
MKRHLTFRDMIAIERVSDPQVSPDGKHACYVTSKHDPDENKTSSTIRLLDLYAKQSRILTPRPGSHSQPRWSRDGRSIAFVSKIEGVEGSQIWVMPFADGGEARQLTKGEGGASQLEWSPSGDRIAFARSVLVSPYYEPEQSKNKKAERADIYGLINKKSSARVEDELLFRHWDSWRDRKRSHVFVINIDTGDFEDVTQGDIDCPPISLGGSQDIAFSPEGNELAVVFNPDKVVARSTNNSVYLIPLDGIKRTGEPKRISISDGCDNDPRYSPDGKHIVFLSMPRPKYEADRSRILVYDRANSKIREIGQDFDRSPSNSKFSSDSRHLYFLAADRMVVTVFRIEISSGKIEQLTDRTYQSAFCIIPSSSDLLVSRECTTHAADLYRLKVSPRVPVLSLGSRADTHDAGATAEQLTTHGDLPADIQMNPIEDFWFEGADGDLVHGAIIKPPFCEKGKKYPTQFIVHGGPQSAHSDQFHYRWNFQMFASEGYNIVLINPRGSTGYGQKFTDQISRDWGGRAFVDLMNGLDYAIKHFDCIDPDLIGASGASYGGYMMNWFEGNSDRFKCIVCHDGIFHAETMSYTTDELWFEEWEHGQLPPTNSEELSKYSPHRFVKNFKTPMLLIHGELDFRCPISEGLAMFTALHVKGVPCRILLFPDEGHWVLQPANSEVWYHEVLDWFSKWLKNENK